MGQQRDSANLWGQVWEGGAFNERLSLSRQFIQKKKTHLLWINGCRLISQSQLSTLPCVTRIRVGTRCASSLARRAAHDWQFAWSPCGSLMEALWATSLTAVFCLSEFLPHFLTAIHEDFDKQSILHMNVLLFLEVLQRCTCTAAGCNCSGCWEAWWGWGLFWSFSKQSCSP